MTKEEAIEIGKNKGMLATEQCTFDYDTSSSYEDNLDELIACASGEEFNRRHGKLKTFADGPLGYSYEVGLSFGIVSGAESRLDIEAS